MKLVRMIEILRSHLSLLIRLGIAVLILLVVLDALPALVDKEYAHTEVEHLPGFWSIFGFLGCVLIILASKAFGHAGIMKREDYYDK